METLTSSPAPSGESFSSGGFEGGIGAAGLDAGASFNYGAAEGFSGVGSNIPSIVPDYFPESWADNSEYSHPTSLLENKLGHSALSGVEVEPYLIDSINAIGELVGEESSIETEDINNYSEAIDAVLEEGAFEDYEQVAAGVEVQGTSPDEEYAPSQLQQEEVSKTILYSEILDAGKPATETQEYFNDLIRVHGGKITSSTLINSSENIVGEKNIEVSQTTKTQDGSIITYKLISNEDGTNYVEVSMTKSEETDTTNLELYKSRYELKWDEEDQSYDLILRSESGEEEISQSVVDVIGAEFGYSRWEVQRIKNAIKIYPKEGVERDDSEVLLKIEAALSSDVPIIGKNTELV